jgi:carbon storage regulator CsrA
MEVCPGMGVFSGGYRMLVLSRKVGEEVLIDGGRIRVKFIRYGGNGAIKLGFEAPPDVKIHRLEIDEEIKLQKGEVHHADNDQ